MAELREGKQMHAARVHVDGMLKSEDVMGKKRQLAGFVVVKLSTCNSMVTWVPVSIVYRLKEQ